MIRADEVRLELAEGSVIVRPSENAAPMSPLELMERVAEGLNLADEADQARELKEKAAIEAQTRLGAGLPWPHGEALGHVTELDLRELLPWQSITRNGDELGMTIQKVVTPIGTLYRLVARRVGELEDAPGEDGPPELVQLQASRDPWAHRSRGMKCRTCMWWAPKAPDPTRAPAQRELGQGSVGRCRRHAPTMGGYPVVFEADWCGDHKLDETKR